GSSARIAVIDEGLSLIAVSSQIDGLSLFDANTRALLRRLRMPAPETDDERFRQWMEHNFENARDRGDDLSVAGLERMRAHPNIDAIRRALAANRRNELVFAMQLDLGEDR